MLRSIRAYSLILKQFGLRSRLPLRVFLPLGIDSIFIIEVLNNNKLCSVDPFCHLAEASAYFFFQDLSFLMINPIESIASQVQNCPPS